MPLQLSNLDFNGTSRALNLPAPVSATEPVRKQDLDAAIEGLSWKDDVRVSTQSNISINSPGSVINGETMAVNDRILVRSQTDPIENGIYIWNGAAIPATRSLDANTGLELREAVVQVAQGSDAGNTFRQTSANIVIGTTAVNWVAFGSSAPNASTSTPGIIAIATQSEVDAGSVANKSLTPATLASWAGRQRKASLVIGDGSATQFDITHNFGTRLVAVTVYRNSSPWDTVVVDEERPSDNIARVRFAVAPASNSFVLMVQG